MDAGKLRYSKRPKKGEIAPQGGAVLQGNSDCSSIGIECLKFLIQLEGGPFKADSDCVGPVLKAYSPAFFRGSGKRSIVNVLHEGSAHRQPSVGRRRYFRSLCVGRKTRHEGEGLEVEEVG